MNSNEDINGLLARHFAHEGLTPRQQSVLDSWIKANEGEYEKLKKLMGAPVATPDPATFDAGAAWRKVEPRLSGSRLWHGLHRRAMLIVSVAAAHGCPCVAVSFGQQRLGRYAVCQQRNR